MTADALDFDADPFGTLRAGSAPLQPSGTLDLFEDETLAYAALGISLRAATESITLERPLNIRLMPTSVPITQTELEGHCLQIKIPRIRVMTPSNSTHPEFGTWRIRK